LHRLPEVRFRLLAQGPKAKGDPSMKSRRLLNLGLLGTGLVSMVSGFLIQLTYHMHHGVDVRATRMVWGLGYPDWAVVHQASSALMLVIAVWHLWLNRRPLFALLKHAGQGRRQARTLFVLFTLAVVTALVAWIAGKLFDGYSVERALVEVHDKIVIPMAVLMVMHTWQRRARLLR
jgi:hypothetical protein